MRILVNKQRYNRQYAIFGKIYKFLLDESNQCWNITGLSFAIKPSPYQAERQPISSKIYESND